MSQVWRLLLQFVTIIVLSRILAVADFGLMTMASVVIMFAELFGGMGMTAGLIQKDRLTTEFISAVFWATLAIGFGIGLIVAGSSAIMSIIFNEPRLAGVLASLSLVFPINALGSSHMALLEREVRFRNIAQSEMCAASLGLTAALALAWTGFGVYALVGQTLVTSIILTTQFWIFSHWRPLFVWRSAMLEGVWRFGGNLVGFNVINYFARNFDNVLVGKFLGTTELGLYNLAFRLMYLPTQTIVYAVNRVLFPVYSEKIRAGEDVAVYFMKVVTLVSLMVAPISLGLWAVREPLVAALLGPQWGPSVAVLAWLAPAGFLQALVYTTGSVFMSAGRADILLKLAALNSGIMVAAFAVSVTFGIVAVGAAYLCAYIAVFIIGFLVTLRFLSLPILDFLVSIWAPVICALVMCAIVSYANMQIGGMFAPIERLIILVPLGTITYFGLIAMTARTLLFEGFSIWRGVKP